MRTHDQPSKGEQNQIERHDQEWRNRSQPTIGARVRQLSTQRVTSKGEKLELNRRKTKSLSDLAKATFKRHINLNQRQHHLNQGKRNRKEQNKVRRL
jgi:hypothetical protein